MSIEAQRRPNRAAVPIHKADERTRLETRREPYWAAPLEPGRYIGFRKLRGEAGSWIARARIERPDEPGAWQQKYRDLGPITEKFDYYAAAEAARAWFDELAEGIVNDEPFTVEMACKEYVEELRREKRDATADDAEWRFERSGITGDAFGRIEVAKLRAPAIKKWRQELDVSEAGQNRMMTSLRAALNMAVENSRVPATVAKYWRAVKQHEGADGQRDNFLTVEQRRALIEAAKGPVRDLIEAALLTGARPGELVSLKRSAFDARTQSVTFVSGKTKKRKGGKRTVPLVGKALTLFEHLAKSKLPSALLLTREDGKEWTRIEWSRRIRKAVSAAVVKDDKGKVVKDEKGHEVKLPPDTCLYDCRHTYISQALQNGMTTFDVATQTGTSLQMIQDHYGHINADVMRERLARVQML